MARRPPLAEFTYEGFAQNAIAQLEELHLGGGGGARRGRSGPWSRARELVGELRDLVARHPLRERLRGQLMLALYRSGRQAEALEVYQDFRRTLSEELGLEPGAGLQQLELAILTPRPRARPSRHGYSRRSAREPGRPARIGAPRAASVGRSVLAVGALLLALALVGAVIASSGGRAAGGDPG